ncbi:MAG: hypothetical protein SFY81_07750 [Verrucomicrobiota bacterium]|nr:hypothetical protein [Verrucomicrobiota bacterium]
MKHFLFACALGISSFAASTPEYHVADKGPHHRTMRATNEVGEVVSQYVHLGTGLNYWSEEEGKWLESDNEIELAENGAVFRKGPFNIIFNANVNDVGGTFDLLLPGNQRVVIQCIGLAYTEADTGRSVFIAELKDTQGELVARNTVLYPNCFEGVNADIRASVRVGAFESDVILREQLPSPDTFGLNPATTRLEVWHQVLENPNPPTTTRVIARNDGSEDIDHSVWFGSMFIGPGKAFTLEQAEAPLGMEKGLLVAKEWVGIEGMTFLIESLPIAEAVAELNGLPEPEQARNVDRKAVETQWASMKKGNRSKPLSLGNVPATKKAKTFASINRGVEPSSPGYLIDYVLLSSATNFTFKGGTTYHVTGEVSLTQTTTIEGGTVVKFTNYASFNPQIKIHGAVVCNTQPYHPAVFTSEDDDSVGEIISGSTGAPSGYYAYYNLLVMGPGTNAVELHDIRTKYAHNGIGIERAGTHRLWNIQSLSNSKGIHGASTDIHAHNVLLYSNYYGFEGGASTTFHAEHVTGHKLAYVFFPNSHTNSFLYLTNSLLVQITNSSVQVFSNYVQTASSGTGVFQETLAGGHYLAESSTHRNAGTTNITTYASALIQTNTTYPPIIITADFTADTTLAPQAQRDTDTPDLGYHYYPLDYVAGNRTLTNTLTMNSGVAVGLYEEHGIKLEKDGIVSIRGTPANPVRLAGYNCVQELLTHISTNGHASLISSLGGTATLPQVGFNLRFAKLFALPGVSGGLPTRHLGGGNSPSSYSLLRDCEFYGGGLRHTKDTTVQMNNCLFENSNVSFSSEDGSVYVYSYNCLFWNGTFSMDDANSDWIFRDNLWVSSTIGGYSSSTNNTHNGYTSGLSLIPGSPGGTDKTNLVATFETGTLGRYYYPATGTSTSLTNLVNTGSRTAAAAGLYHFTTQTNQTKEAATQVDIGYHYVAWNSTNNIPFDTDGDGIPDYQEDRNGNGEYDVGETDWEDYNSLNGLTGNPGLEVFTPLQ